MMKGSIGARRYAPTGWPGQKAGPSQSFGNYFRGDDAFGFLEIDRHELRHARAPAMVTPNKPVAMRDTW